MGDAFGVPAFDDLRELLLKGAPQVLLMDRPDNVGVDFLTACLGQGIGLMSLGPPVVSVTEAAAVAECLDARTALVRVWPRLEGAASYMQSTQADEFVRPVRFGSGTWTAWNHVAAKAGAPGTDVVRSLSVLAWDALATLIGLLGLPESVYASIRGSGGRDDTFIDLTGAASLTLRFAEGVTVSVTLSDRIGPWRRELLLMGQDAVLRLDERQYQFTRSNGEVIDEARTPEVSGAQRAADELRAFIREQGLPASPHKGWLHRLPEISATMEAMVVSQRTGQAEAPERFLYLRR
jgi:predicted dehydrogenase